jgi:arylsulfatase A-like enzyme
MPLALPPVRNAAVTLMVVGAFLLGTGASAQSTDRPPNIVLIVADYLGYGDIGPYGATDIPTPTLDRLAAQGARFTDHYAAAPVCGPSRAALVSGLYPARLGFEANISRPEDGLPARRDTLVRELKQAGYATALVGKWHLGQGPEFDPEAHGFDRFFGFHTWTIGYHDHRTQTGEPGLYRGRRVVDEKGYLTDLFSRESVRFIDEHRDTPFFLYLAYNAGLPPYQTPDMAPGRWQAAWDVNTATRADLAAMVESMDRGIGQVLAALDRTDNARRTLVIFTYDHGGRHLVRSDPLFHGFSTLWEGGIRVPLMVRWPGRLAPSTVVTQPTIAMDLTATMLDAAGRATATANLDGISLRPLLAGTSSSTERPFFWRFGPQKAARIGPWKLVIERNTQLLFNLGSDISERHDAFREQPGMAQRLREALAGWEQQMQEAAPQPRP